MKIYAESSAVLAWLLGEKGGNRVLRGAELVASPDLTLVECTRGLIRAVKLGEIDEATAADLRAYLNAASAHWHVLRISSEIVSRTRNPFPGESIRALNAIHLGSALAGRSAVSGLELLSLDDRIRQAGKQLAYFASVENTRNDRHSPVYSG